MCTSTPGAEIPLANAHSLIAAQFQLWLVPFSAGRSCQKGCRTRTVNRSPPGLQLVSGNTNMDCSLYERAGQRGPTEYSGRTKTWMVLFAKASFADNVPSLFRELPEYTEDAEVEWQLFKTVVALSVARVCGREGLSVANNGTKVNAFVEPGG